MRHQSGDDIGVFLEVCQANSFAAASAQLGLTPSAVAKSIARLERRLNVMLFQRTTRRLNLTAEGLIYENACRRARLDVERTEAMIQGLVSEPVGTLRVTLPPLFGAHVIAPALYDLGRQYPGLEFQISATTQSVDLLGDGIDLAIRIGELPDLPGLMTRRLGTQRVVLCASSDYFQKREFPRALDDLAGHDIIASSRGTKPLPWSFRQADGTVIGWAPKSRLLLDGSLLALSAIRDGYGMGLLPHWLVQYELEAGRLVSVLDDCIAGHLPIHAIWPASPVMLPRLRVAIDAIVKVARDRLSPHQSP